MTQKLIRQASKLPPKLVSSQFWPCNWTHTTTASPLCREHSNYCAAYPHLARNWDCDYFKQDLDHLYHILLVLIRIRWQIWGPLSIAWLIAFIPGERDGCANVRLVWVENWKRCVGLYQGARTKIGVMGTLFYLLLIIAIVILFILTFSGIHLFNTIQKLSASDFF